MDSCSSALKQSPEPQLSFYRTFFDSINDSVAEKSQFSLLAFEPKDLKGLNHTFGFHEADRLLFTANKIIEQELSKSGFKSSVLGTKGRQFAFIDSATPIFLLALHKKVNRILNYHFGGLLSFRALKIDFETPGNTPDKILLEAETGFKESKEQGIDTHVKYVNEKSKGAVTHCYHSLRRAINHQEFVLHYQPIVCVKTGRAKALEALARWRQGNEDLAPGFFIDDLTKHGLMSEFGAYVCQKALQQHAAWANSSNSNIHLSINVSLQQLKTEHFREEIIQLIEHHELPAQSIQIEITEDQIEDAETLKELRQLKEQVPIKIAVDDFGAGLSNIARLRHLDIDVIKIDKSILHQCKNQKDEIFLNKMIQMCKAIAKEIIIEGVETEEQKNLAIRCGVDAIQGFYYNKPQPPEYIDISNI